MEYQPFFFIINYIFIKNTNNLSFILKIFQKKLIYFTAIKVKYFSEILSGVKTTFISKL